MNTLTPRSNRTLNTLFTLGALAFALNASAQTAAPPPPLPAQPGMQPKMPGHPHPGPRPGAMAAEPFVNVEATVTAYLLSPEAEVAGLMLDNGRQVRVPPHLGAQLAELVQPGQRVRVDSSSPAAPLAAPAAPAQPGAAPMPRPMRAPLTITAIASGRSLVDTPPVPGTLPPAPRAMTAGQAALQPMKASGTVKQVLTGPRGETRGVMLDNGTQVAIPPHAQAQAGELLAMGTRLNVEGYGRSSTYGTALQATSIGKPGETPVTMYAAPLPR